MVERVPYVRLNHAKNCIRFSFVGTHVVYYSTQQLKLRATITKPACAGCFESAQADFVAVACEFHSLSLNRQSPHLRHLTDLPTTG
jgi:hypothetical protein